MRQETALAILKTGQNVFLTGSAGTGKTYVLNQYIKYLKDRGIGVAVTASTGIAATHMNGQTIHSWCGMGVKNSIHQVNLPKLAETKYIKKNIEKASVLIIDEISMLHKNQLEMVDEILMYVRGTVEPFGGLQVVLSGDFFQLPPVTKNEETNREKFAFMAKSWVQAQFQVCYLTEQYRQTENELTNLLNEIRAGEVSDSSISLLDEAVYNRFKQDPTKLYTHNFDVDRLNQQELGSLAGEEEVFVARSKGNEGLIEMLKKSVLAPENLYLKENAKVMFVRNKHDQGYMNGTMGIVTGFSDETGTPVVQLNDGTEIITEEEVWSVEDESGKTLASYIQIPLRLAWAITVHKSQGMTLDEAEIDLNKTFEAGQGYVALSRLKSFNGLRLLGYNEVALEVDGLAMKADKRFQELSEEAESRIDQTDVSRRHLQFLKRVGGLSDPQEIERYARRQEAKSQKLSTQEQTRRYFEDGLSLKQIAKERGLTTGTIISHLVSLKTDGVELEYDRLKPSLKGADELTEAVEALKKRGKEADFLENGLVKSKVLYDYLNGKYSYEKINLFKLFQ